ncbi:hypothetical protein V5799_005209, partial [Amblyomma americanum]
VPLVIRSCTIDKRGDCPNVRVLRSDCDRWGSVKPFCFNLIAAYSFFLRPLEKLKMWRSAPDMVRSVLSKYQRECLLQEEGSRQAEKRQSLEEAAWRLVCKLPHANKFVCKPVEAVLRRALEDGASFEPLQAATAFAALEEYATNLLLQPWRTELFEIKLYSGYYKHTVERHLKNAETVLQLMGYEKRESSVMHLGHAVDTATLGDVALDCLIAAAECRVSRSSYPTFLILRNVYMKCPF